MPRKGDFGARPGFQRIPGRARSYVDLRTGELISRRQYMKRTENIPSLEYKAKKLKRERYLGGIRQPMKRTNAIIDQYKLIHPGMLVRGDSAEAKWFREIVAKFKKPQTANIHTQRGKQQRKAHLKYGWQLGIMTEAQYDKYTQEIDEMSE
jgi:hypothetical protein